MRHDEVLGKLARQFLGALLLRISNLIKSCPPSPQRTQAAFRKARVKLVEFAIRAYRLRIADAVDRCVLEHVPELVVGTSYS